MKDWDDVVATLADISEKVSLRCSINDLRVMIKDRRGNVLLTVYADCPLWKAEQLVGQLRDYVKTP